MQEEATNPFPTLEGRKNINLTTFRKSGESVVTPVWYVAMSGKLYVRTQAEAGKVKRVRNNGRVQLAPGTVRGKAIGPTVEAWARVLEAEEEDLAKEAMRTLRRRYRTTPILDSFIGNREHVVLEIVPVGREAEPHSATSSLYRPALLKPSDNKT